MAATGTAPANLTVRHKQQTRQIQCRERGLPKSLPTIGTALVLRHHVVVVPWSWRERHSRTKPDSAKAAGNVRAAALSLLNDEFADSLEIIGPDPPPPDAQLLCHGLTPCAMAS
jgi:hypothetical protein